MIKVAFGTVIYKNAWEFEHEFIESINKQTAEFDVIILNDDCTEKQILDLKEDCKKNTVLINTNSRLSPGELRLKLIRYAKEEEYDLLVLGDFDDVFQENRVEEYIKAYSEKYCFFYNSLVDFQGVNLMPDMPLYTSDIDDILDYNYLGLSNTGINLNNISIKLLEEMDDKDIEIFDWYFFSMLLLNKEQGVLLKDTATYYRIYDRNIAGITQINNVDKEIKIKISHYSRLAKYSKEIKNKLLLFELLGSKDSRNFCSYEIKRNNKFWWGLIQDINFSGEGE